MIKKRLQKLVNKILIREIIGFLDKYMYVNTKIHKVTWEIILSKMMGISCMYAKTTQT